MVKFTRIRTDNGKLEKTDRCKMFGKNSSCCVVCYINALYFTLSHKCPVCGCPFWPTSFRRLIYESENS